jgi:hypothetical protein
MRSAFRARTEIGRETLNPASASKSMLSLSAVFSGKSDQASAPA